MEVRMPKSKRALPKKAAEKEQMSLSELLVDIRRVKKLSLRAVEEATGKEVSNAYLSQLENGHIKKPSPNILHALSSVYAIPYDLLMEKAGYITQTQNSKDFNLSNRIATFAGQELTEIEEEELLRYLAFMRSKKSN
jgi:HTH-type transcriptional regulator, competence development regulator